MTTPYQWTGRVDPEDGDSAKRYHQIIQQTDPKDAITSLIGFACDLGVARNKGRIGAANGPDAIRTALANLAWHGSNGSIFDHGNIHPDTSLLEAQEKLGNEICDHLDAGSKTLVLGGGHETAAGSFQGLLKHLTDKPDKTIAIINLDAHFDLRKPGEAGVSSGTPFYQIHDMLADHGQSLKYLCLGVAETSNTKALFERAHNWGVEYVLDRDMRAHQMDQIYTKIDHFLKDADYLYFTVDLDVLPHWQMPGVSAPSAYGVELGILEDIIRHVSTNQINWLLSDVVELNPELDKTGNSAKTAARLCDQIIRAMENNL